MTGLSDGDIDRFSSLIAKAKNENAAEVEVPRRVIEYYNKGNLTGFDKVGYFVYQNIKVYETGKKEESKAKENKTMEQLLHGN